MNSIIVLFFGFEYKNQYDTEPNQQKSSQILFYQKNQNMKTKKLIKLILLLLFSINIYAQVPPYVPTNGLVGWWPFTGNANDLSGNGNNGTNNGATLTTDRFLNPNSAYSFNGNNVISALNPLSSLSSDFSISNFVKFTNWNGGIFVHVGLDQVGCPCNGFGVGYGGGQANSPGQNFLSGWGGVSWNQSGYSFNNLNQWYHSTIVKFGNTLRYYINGLLVGTNIVSNFQTPTNSLYFGASAINTSNLNSILDDIGIWNRALNECEIKQLFNASVLPSPTVIASTSNSVICIGGSAILTASTTATTYTWNTGATTVSISVSPTVTSTYTITGTNTLSCVASAVLTVTVNVNPTITVNNGTICSGQNFTITPAGANSYTIQGGNAVVNPSINTTYTVIGTSAAGCLSQAFSTSSLTVNLCVGISNQNIGLGVVSIYPNPNNGEFTIKLVSVNNTFISITNVLGQIIKAQKAELFNQIDLSNQISGVYTINIITDKKIKYSTKVIKE